MKSPIQTAFEKLSDEELKAIYDLASDRKKGAQARLWVLTNSLENERKTRGTRAVARGINLITHPEKGLAKLIKNVRADQSARANLVNGTIHAMDNLDNESFMDTARAHYGVNDFFGDQAMQAAQNLDEQFFKSAMEAIKTLKSKARKSKSKAGESTMLIHIQTALTFLHEGDHKGQLPQRKVTKQKLREVLEMRLGGRSFSSKSKSWPEFFKRPEIRPFVEREKSGGRPTTSGKGRGVESFESIAPPKTAGG